MFELIQRIEEQSDSLTPTQLETFRLNAVACSDEDTPVIKYIRNPSKAVKEKAITIRPDHIKYIRFQYPAIQELALFVAFSYMCIDLNYFWSRNITLDSVYKLLKNPLQNVTQIYKDLKDMYNNPQNITKLKYQNEYVHRGMLELASDKNLDFNRVFNMFQKPTEDIKHIYEWTLKQQQEEQRRQRMREMFSKMYSNVYF